MSITSALNNAFSGLSTSAKRAEVVSNNISNAMTENFGRREVELSSYTINGFGSGVRSGNINRAENLVLTAARREADGIMSEVAVLDEYSGRIADKFGQVDDQFSLTGVYQSFGGALVFASNNPSSEIALSDVGTKANELAVELNTLSDDLNELRLSADRSIGDYVDNLNQNLKRLEKLNIDIREMQLLGRETGGLKDQQHALLDQVNELIPVKVVNRDYGRVALFTPDGGTLLDDTAKLVGFNKVGSIDHSMTLGNGALSDLSIDGTSVGFGANDTLYSGGAIGALFELRDSRLPQINNQVDSLAEDLILRFQDPSIDPTLSPTDPGLFSDGGSFYSIGNQVGLAGRISVSTQLDVGAGGGVWRIRDGLNAVTQGSVGNNNTLHSLASAFQVDRSPPVGSGALTGKSAFELSAFVSSDVQAKRSSVAENLAYQTAQSQRLKQSEAAVLGVNTDKELQDLIEIESAYSANAKVMAVLDELVTRLLEI